MRVGMARDETVLATIDSGRGEPRGNVFVVEERRCCRGRHRSGARDDRNLTRQENRRSGIGDIEHGKGETLNEGIQIFEGGATS